MPRFAVRLVVGLSLAATAAGCQNPRGGDRQSMLGLSQPPRMFNGSGTSLLSDQGAPGATLANRQGNGILGQADPQLFNQLADQVRDLNQRLGGFNTDNQQLVVELASSKQKLQAANEYNFQLKQQLADSINQLQLLQREKQTLEQQMATSQPTNLAAQSVAGSNTAPTQPIGTATMHGNNSLLRKLASIQIPGATPRMDGDVIRVEIPTDPLFVPGTYQINPNAAGVLDALAVTLQRDFSGQIVGIEGHWDNSPLQPQTTTHHQLTATQALAVQEYLVRRGTPERQLFTMAMGSNRPRHGLTAATGVNPNRRIEVVIYPENYSGN